ncbi:hypothetical protein Trydic_g9607 [Trypoxylus dichotomus]
MNDNHDTMFELLQKLPDCEDATKEDFIGWLNRGGKEKVTVSNILNLPTLDIMEEDENANDESAELHKISHSEDDGVSITVRIGISTGCHTDLVVGNESLTAVRYSEEILDPVFVTMLQSIKG